MTELAPGAFHFRGYLDGAAQEALAAEIAAVIDEAPLYVCTMPKSGAPMSVRMTNCGQLGWLSDKLDGYRYETLHPLTGAPWPPIPEILMELWDALTGYPKPPEACLINVYDSEARMGLHQDCDEHDFEAPIVSISLGADCRFKLGGLKRSNIATGVILSSGDVLVLSGPSRLRFHGVDRIFPTLAPPLPGPLDGLGARVNLTLRRVT
ncbi:MAG: alpha-ketoglutarate-dependent dioxygenase AlkB [Methylocystis sp.]|nr:alpha-ketoglutarate-dependent dioxygenase AlkB [Methylocystis sp.]